MEGRFPILPAVSAAAGGSHSLTVSRETKTWSSVICWLWREYLTQSGCSININWIDDPINKWMSDGKEVAADVPRQRWCSAVWREEGGGIRTWLRRFSAHVQLSTLDSASGQIFNHCQEMEAQAQSSNDWHEKRNSNKWPKYIELLLYFKNFLNALCLLLITKHHHIDALFIPNLQKNEKEDRI